MTDRPILFSQPMVRALLAGSKTQTRRILKPQPNTEAVASGAFQREINGLVRPSPIRFAIGDKLWVRETWRPNYGAEGYREDIRRVARPSDFDPQRTAIEYLADDTQELNGKTRPGIHMPRWASRLTLTVNDVRVQRLQDISEEDALAEGVATFAEGRTMRSISDAEIYRLLWEEINGPGSWEANPWVVAYSFTVERRNIDAREGEV